MSLWRSRRRIEHEQTPTFQPNPRRARKGRQKQRSSRYEQFEPRRLLAVSPRLVSIIPNEGELLVDGQTRDVAPRELTFRFSEGQIINPSTLGGIQIVRSNFDGVFGDGDDIAITPGFIGIGDRPNEVVVRFADALPDDLYQIRIVGTGTGALRNQDGDAFNNGADQTIRFDMDLGAQVIAVVPQPVTRLANGSLSQSRNQIEVYFNNDNLNPASATNPSFYQLIFTNNTGNNQDDQVFLPASVTYDAASDKAVLTFTNDLASLGAGQGSYRLRIGNADPIPTAPTVTETAVDQGATFATAQNIGPLSSQSKVINAAIDPQLFRLELPGDLGEPGHRESPSQQHLLAERAPDSTVGTTTAFYNFQSIYGTDLLGNPAFNVITEVQKQRVREVLSLYSYYAGVQFIESDAAGMTIALGDPRILDPTVEAGPGGVLGIAGGGLTGTAIIDAVEPWGASEFGGDFFNVVMHEIGHLLGLGHADELAPLTIMSGIYDNTIDVEKVFPGDQDIVHLRYLYRPEVKDIDVYRFTAPSAGTVTAESIAERLGDGSGLDSLVAIYDSTGKLVARNDDYFGNDSLTQVDVVAGDYYVVVSSTGNNEYNLNVEDSGFEGTTQGSYSLRLDFTPKTVSGMVDSTGTLFDGDADGAPGGAYNFWFQVATADNTIFVDKAATTTSGPLGSIGNPFRTIREAIDPAQATSARAGDVLRVIGNGGADGDVTTLADNLAYEIGFNSFGSALSDGSLLRVPKGVSMLVDAGAVFKLRRANIDVGSSSLEVDRSQSSLQILGTPTHSVYFTSYQNEQIGLDTAPQRTTPAEGDWGGLVFRNTFDFDAGRSVLETEGIFLNYVNHAVLTYGGGDVLSESRQQSFSPIHMESARPTITYNAISRSGNAAMSANPDSFLESRFESLLYTADYGRVGPEVHANRLTLNTINGLFVRIATETLSEQPLDKMNVSGRFDDTDVVHVISENLVIRGNPGGRALVIDETTGDETTVSRPDGRLKIDPGIVVKLDSSRIETEIGADFMAEGDARNRIIFTSLLDDRYGGSGTFDTGGADPNALPEPGDWGGLYFGPTSDASLDQVLITYAGGINAIDGDFAGFNPIEIHQAKVRVANSVLELNDDGFAGAVRVGLTENGEGTIFISGAQPVLINNTIRDNAGPAMNVNVNALNSIHVTDWGRSTGVVDIFTGVLDNFGPLIRGNLLSNNGTNGMIVRGAKLTTQSVWDDTDITHVLLDTVTVDNHHTFSGLRLQSNPNESLVVKLFGTTAGFTASGLPLDIDDRIGGAVHLLGVPGHPVILTSLRDDTVGASLDPDGNVVFDTNNDGILSSPAAGDWRSVRIESYSNDRNVEVINEQEASVGAGTNANSSPESAQPLGELATSELNGDDNRRLGFEVHGFLNSAAPGDVDVYSFRAIAGTVVWIDIDRTAYSLDTVLELIDGDGNVLARSDDSFKEFENPTQLVGAAKMLQTDVFKSRDQYGTNPRDAGMRVVLPGSANSVPKTYFVRVRAKGDNIDNLTGGRSMGEYQMQIRLRELDEVPGSTVRYADIRNATNGIEVIGMPTRSPLLGDAAENLTLPNGVRAEAQDLGNLLAADLGVISVAGDLATADGLDVDWFQFQLNFALTQASAGFLGTLFDIDYADGLARPDTTLALFDQDGHLIMISRDSNITDDQQVAAANTSVGDAGRGSYGSLDPYAGPFDIPVGPTRTYYLAVMSNKVLPTVLNATYQLDAMNPLVRLEPLPETVRIAEDRLATNGGTSTADPLYNLFPEGIVNLNNFADTVMLSDVNTWVVTGSEMFTVDAYSGYRETDVTEQGKVLPGANENPFYTYSDVAMRNDGRIFTIANPADPDDATLLREILPTDGSAGVDYTIEQPDFSVFTGLDDSDPPEPQYDDAPDGTRVYFEAMTWATGEQPRRRLLYAIGHIPGADEGFDMSDDPDNPGLDKEFYPNLFFTIAGDEYFARPAGTILNIPQNPTEIEPFDGAIGLDTRVRGVGGVMKSGGIITGMAIIPVPQEDGPPVEKMFAVTDEGHLFEIQDFDTPEPKTHFVKSFVSGGQPVPFAGLTAGPPNAEGGIYASVLFATTEDGRIITIGPEGDALGMLRDGSEAVSSVAATGITFTRFDYNLWHITGRRDTDAGHGIDGQLGSTRTRADVFDNSTYYFGLEDPRVPTTRTVQPYAAAMVDTNNGIYAPSPSYDVPGGAFGSLTTNTFDLSPYTSSDKPTLYFNYFAQTEGAASRIDDYTLMRDSFRVYGTRDGANWIELTTNNSFKSNNVDELSELPNAISASGGNYRQDPYPNQRVQETFDAGPGETATWRQARVDLGDLAGSRFAQLRFEFSTAASVDFGMDARRALGATAPYFSEGGTGGIAVSPLPGAEIRDGEFFTLQALINGLPFIQKFEFDSGFTFVVPVDAGTTIQDGERFSVTVPNPSRTFTFEFDRNGTAPNDVTKISINNYMSSADIAKAIWTAIATVYADNDVVDPVTLEPLVWVNGARVNLGQTVNGVSQSANAKLQRVGSAPGDTLDPDAAPILIHEGMTREQVTVAMSRDIDAGMATNAKRPFPLDASPDFGAIAKPDGKGALRVFGYEVGIPGPLAVGVALAGEQLVLPVPTFSGDGPGKYYGDFTNLVTENFRAKNNRLEGVYIDDFVIGLAERGELVVHADAHDETVAVPQYPEEGEFFAESVRGPYQLEIRQANTLTDQTGKFFDAIETNDRLAEGMTMYAPAGAELRDGSLVKLSDGTSTLVLEFDTGNGVATGNVRVLFDGSETANEMAVEIRKVINAQSKAKIKADTTPSLANPIATTNVVQLYGAVGFAGGGDPDAEPNDTISEAIDTGLSTDAPGTWTRTGYIGDSGQFNDVDFFSIDLKEGDSALIDIDVDRLASVVSVAALETLHAALRVFDAAGNEVSSIVNSACGLSGSFVPLLPMQVPPCLLPVSGPYAQAGSGEIPSYDPIYRFIAPFTGKFFVGISSGGALPNLEYDPEIARSGAGTSIGPYQVTVTLGGAQAVSLNVYDTLFGDDNPERQQGQVILQGNVVTDSLEYGIRVDADDRTTGNRPHPGVPINTPTLNINRLTPGVTIKNNVIDGPRSGGILFSGDADPTAAVVFGRIINNTIYGNDEEISGTGIEVTENASPTLINNIVSNFSTGIVVDTSSASTVIGGTVYKGNGANTIGTGLGSFSLVLDPLTPSDPEEPLFIDAPRGNFYLAPNSKAIDSSINSLQDRPYMVSIGSPLGISPSPILAPERDALGQLRVNDPDVPSPPGLGSNVFKDRGALDRADFTGPSAVLIVPEDGSLAGGDLDPSPNSVLFVGQTVTRFALQIVDGILPADPQAGAGVDDATVTASRFQLRRDGVLLTLGADYFFVYDSLNNVARLIAAEGIWTPGTYTVNVNNTLNGGVRDVAGNVIKPNNVEGETEFTVRLATADFGDAPPQFPTIAANQGAVHVLSSGLFLGAGVTADDNGQPSSDAVGDVDDGVQFGGALFAGQTATISVRSSAVGKLDAWIDFNGDGDWNDAGEQVFVSRALSAGLNTLNFAVPTGAITGDTFARFRLSTAGGLSPTGLAVDGEVEDYLVTVAPPITYSVVVTSVNGQELAKDLDGRYGVGPGSEVVIQVYVDDQRSLATGGGVRAAFADLVASTNTIDFVAGSLTYGATFGNSRAGTITAGQVDEAGGVGSTAPGTDRQLVFSVRGKVKSNAAANAVVDLNVNAAEDPAHETKFYGSDSAIPPAFGQASLIVLSHPYQNPGNRFDVNADGVVSGLDALILINRINANGGPLTLPIPVASAQPPYLDPNGDSALTALDVLQVINEINRRAAGTQSLLAQAGTEESTGAPRFDFGAISTAIGSAANSPTFAGAFLPTTLSPKLTTPAADVVFSDDVVADDSPLDADVTDDVWSDDDFSAEFAVARSHGENHANDELASLWNRETQDWTSATRESIVEKRSAKRWS